MSYLSAIFLGIIQGVAEFLPISSSGHLSIFQNFFGLTDVEGDHLFFDVLLHFGTLIAVFFVYRVEILDLILECISILRGEKSSMGKRAGTSNRRMILLLIIGTLPLLLVLFVKDYLEGLYSNTIFIGVALIVTGLMLYLSDRIKRGQKTERTASLWDAFLVGLAQAFATVPGISRSGSTISAGLGRGFERTFAVKFSFFLSIPAILGANVLSLIDAISTGVDWTLFPQYLVGVVAAMIAGFLSLRFLKRLTEKSGLGAFSFYCWGAGIVTLILSLIK